MHHSQRSFALCLSLACTAVFAQNGSDYGYEYFNTVGRVIGEAKAIPWTAEICSEAFPSEKPAIETALAAWRQRNREANLTLDSQFDVIQTYWNSLPGNRGHQTKQQMVDQLNSQQPALKKSLESGEPANFKRVCSVYAEALQSKRMDIEVKWPSQMAVIRRGPR